MIKKCIHFLLLLLPLCSSSGTKYVNPLLYTEENGIYIYEKTGTIIYRYYMPPRDEENLLISESVCSSPTNPSAGYCPLIYYLQDITERLESLITKQNNYNKFSARPPKIKCTGEIVKVFSSTYTSTAFVEDYFEQVRKCGEDFMVLHETDFNYTEPFQGLYERAHTAYDTVYYQGPSDTQEFQASHALFLSNINSVGLLHYLAESILWKEAIADCKAGFIPRSIISDASLISSLETLLVKVRRENYNFVMPSIDMFIGEYFISDLVDCTFSGNELTIKISVPLKHKESELKYIQLLALPFKHDFQNQTHVCLVDDFKKGVNYIYDKNTKQYVTAKCSETSNLCFFERQQDTPETFMKTCESQILKIANDENIVKYCSFTCYDIEDFDLPIIFKKSDTVVVVDHPPNSGGVIVSCPGMSDETYQAPDEGALEIKLPCGCTLLGDNGNKIIVAIEPCSNTLTVSEIQPKHFK